MNSFHLSVPNLNFQLCKKFSFPKRKQFRIWLLDVPTSPNPFFTCLFFDQFSLVNGRQAYQCRQNHFSCLSSIRADFTCQYLARKELEQQQIRNLTFVSHQMSNSAFSCPNLTNDETKRMCHYKKMPHHESSSVLLQTDFPSVLF